MLCAGLLYIAHSHVYVKHDTATKSVDSQWVSILEHSVILRNYVQ